MPQPSPAPLKLVLTTTSLRNVTIATDTDEFYYEIVTYKWDPLRTKIRKLDLYTDQMPPIAELKMEYEKSRYTGVRFTNASHDDEEKETFLPLETFFEVGSGDRSDILGSFIGNDDNRYQWRQVKGQTELFRIDDLDTKSLARFHTHHRHLGVLRLSQKPYIDIDSQLSKTLDTVIVSFLIAEGIKRGF